MGRPITTAEAKQLANAILEHAETARREYADSDVFDTEDTQDARTGLRFDVVAMVLVLALGAAAFQMYRRLEAADRQIVELRRETADAHARLNEFASLNWVRIEMEEAEKKAKEEAEAFESAVTR